jgi:hypothetical protein
MLPLTIRNQRVDVLNGELRVAIEARAFELAALEQNRMADSQRL